MVGVHVEEKAPLMRLPSDPNSGSDLAGGELRVFERGKLVYALGDGRLTDTLASPGSTSLSNPAGLKALALPIGDALVAVMRNAQGSIAVHHVPR